MLRRLVLIAPGYYCLSIGVPDAGASAAGGGDPVFIVVRAAATENKRDCRLREGAIIYSVLTRVNPARPAVTFSDSSRADSVQVAARLVPVTRSRQLNDVP